MPRSPAATQADAAWVRGTRRARMAITAPCARTRDDALTLRAPGADNGRVLGGKQQRGEATIERVLDAALACWADASSDDAKALTVQTLARDAGVSIGSLYHHFGSLDGVAAALYRRSMAAKLDGIAAALPKRARNAKAGVVAFVKAYLAWTAANPAAARFIHGSAYAPFLKRFEHEIRDDKAQHLAPILAWFEPYIAAGEVVALPGPYYEMLLVGPVAEVARRWLAGAPGLDPETAAKVLPDRVWAALAP